ncbi:MAG: tRNA (N6-threonylcarbamoyladenosine(37)-N6)-methyltransferase TrmO [Candidatus Nezhaarchaeota archaeon]|nr:tRNA (N6-threonylcarbamoyladenosine(37)-N6)-methyltransferase TrmO [Candidatus Nezhaarchaeota archaeon]
MSVELSLRPIGFVRTPLKDEEVRDSWPQGVEASIEILEEYEEGLTGVEGFSHLIVIFYMHKVSEEQRRVLKVRFRRIAEKLGLSLEELPLVGVFCSDSPHRPNPLGVTIVELIERRGRLLRVRGLDAYDGTPVLDIKPYTPDRRISTLRLPKWYEEIEERLRAAGLAKPP